MRGTEDRSSLTCFGHGIARRLRFLQGRRPLDRFAARDDVTGGQGEIELIGVQAEQLTDDVQQVSVGDTGLPIDEVSFILMEVHVAQV